MKNGMQYAIHAYAWTGNWTVKSLELIDRAKHLGFDCIEIPLMDLTEVDPKAIARRLKNLDLLVCTSTACAEDTDPTSDDKRVREAAVKYLKSCVDASAAMGAGIFTGVTYAAIGRRLNQPPTSQHWARAAECLKELAIYARQYDMIIGIEPVNRYETFLINTADQALQLNQLIDEPNVRVHLDSYHMNIEEQDFAEATKAARSHLCHFHLSESHRGTVGTGMVPWQQIMGTLVETDYRGLVGMESFGEISQAMSAATCIWRTLVHDTDESLRIGLRYLRQLESQIRAVHQEEKQERAPSEYPPVLEKSHFHTI